MNAGGLVNQNDFAVNRTSLLIARMSIRRVAFIKAENDSMLHTVLNIVPGEIVYNKRYKFNSFLFPFETGIPLKNDFSRGSLFLVYNRDASRFHRFIISF